MPRQPVSGSKRNDERVAEPGESGGFRELGLRGELIDALTGLGYEEPTPIQEAAIPPLLEGRDLLGQAATGTGKTAAFALPILQHLGDGDRGKAASALVLVPTRELCIQVSQALHRYGRGLGARVLPVYGGQPIGRQLRELSHGVDVLVATPGRLLDHLNRLIGSRVRLAGTIHGGAKVIDHHPGPFGRHELADFPAYPTATTGHSGDFSFQ